ncbi:MAG: ferric reductase-like transmembrane domain-containing protein [Acidimicrobiales bacterium]
MSREMWYLTRSSGVVAAVLMVAALLWGFLFSSRETGKRLRPAWWLDLHNYLGGLSLVFVAIHIVASMLDANSGIGLKEIFVPGSAADGWAIGWGVLATYALVVVVFTTWPRRLANRFWWRVIHVTSVPATALALLHGYQSGSDASQLWFRAGLLVAVGVSTYALGLRLFGLDRSGRRRASARAA